MSIKELKQLLALSKEELQQQIGITGTSISDIQYVMSQEAWYRHIFTLQRK